jgi:hypothetical protein
MTVTRYLQAGFESNAAGSVGVPGAEIPLLTVGLGNTITVETAAACTGSYGLRVKAARYSASGNTYMPQTSELTVPLPANAVRVRFGFWFKFKANSHVYTLNLNTYKTRPTFFRLMTGTSVIARVEWDSDNGLRVTAAGQTAQVVGTKRPDLWCHLGVDVYIHPSAGHVRVWEDGALMYSFDGKTDLTANITQIERLLLGIESGATGEYDLDDFYLDLADAADPITPPLNLRFFYQHVTGDGHHQAWVKSSSGAATHTALVSDRPHDGHKPTDTYVKAQEAGLSETFLVAPYVPQAGWKLRALIPVYYAKKAFGADDTNVEPILRRDGVDHLLPVIVLDPFYTVKFVRLTADPATDGAWTTEAVNAYESGLKSQGDFS